ncbi:RNA-binding cell elongation regulator Jag/EloR [Thermoanaerobacterium thermosaccharolyticum]|jgi:spoIIIJ-associated protein|uniref:RNA-binding protein KhpB n=2 Tax=Thermoanaerobacterium thermosaccharolyticum TaxID=1517 RepID=A0A223HY81_THETR|nr:RNA-binding cell elongation regulator Jag/EloR [Thermoanaerobacterium thermosaccharolyticum]TCW35266.1 spoIIIJ-associated protein [Thermohydrogenium kirishiense]AGB20328.1 putative RNA-binding protein [Thermoanaerobacterium thermosaccharolyticum M0795]AST57436.1 DNA-binding protein [Thermoanaerobacterium thermosaccharolyticum]KAA5806542.1 protein jag [Thermoanaerobacterium thermosaccharolyticum]MBE0069192.1 protein jag [Thermoanaerobacterium thermosaccharolyticum]
MREIIKTGKTVEEAINAGLIELGISRDMVDIEIIDEGSKGFLGLLGKQAIVKIIVKDVVKENIRKFLDGIIKLIGIDVGYDIDEKDNNILVNLKGNGVGLLIGYRGETLDSLQYLTSLVANKKNIEGIHKRILLDAENYREKREKILINLANKIAKKVKQENRSITLEPMNANERRIIHLALQDDPDIETFSEGEEPNRRVTISLK